MYDEPGSPHEGAVFKIYDESKSPMRGVGVFKIYDDSES